jgi:hypothetical protein
MPSLVHTTHGSNFCDARLIIDLTFAKCDGYFRRIAGNTLFVPGERRELRGLQSATTSRPTTSSPARASSATSSVVGSCRGCPVTSSGTFSLYNNVIRLRRLQNDLTTTAFDGRLGQDVCICPELAEDLGRMLQRARQEDLAPNATEEYVSRTYIQQCYC